MSKVVQPKALHNLVYVHACVDIPTAKCMELYVIEYKTLPFNPWSEFGILNAKNTVTVRENNLERLVGSRRANTKQPPNYPFKLKLRKN